MAFGGQAQTSRRGEGQRARIASNLADNADQIAASEPFFECEQRILWRSSGDMNQTVTQIGWQALHTGPPAQPDRHAILHPQHLATIIILACRSKRIARQGKRQPCSARLAAGCKNLGVQRLLFQTRTPARIRSPGGKRARDAGAEEGRNRPR